MNKQTEMHIIGAIQTEEVDIQEMDNLPKEQPTVTSRGGMTTREKTVEQEPIKMATADLITTVLEQPKTMYVTAKNGLNARETFSIDSVITKTLPYTTQVTITEEYQDWVKIGENQWVKENYLSEIQPKIEKKTKTPKQTVTNKTNVNTDTTDNTSNYIAFSATGYCSCSKCCGKSTGRTASGAMAQAGVTVAMPSRYAFGTKIEIKGMGTYTVQDRGGAIQGNRIDIFFNSHQEALNFGRRTVYLRIL